MIRSGISDWRMALNNWVQGRYGTTKCLTYEDFHAGSQDDGQWTRIVYCEDFMSIALFQIEFYLRRIDEGIERGRGTDRTKGGAAERASNQALVSLRGY
jgi:hypothetical protein